MTEIGSPDGVPTPADSGPRMNRRGLIGGLALGTVAVGAGAVGVVAARAIAANALRRERLVVEVACLADTWRENTRGNPQGDADFRGHFVVEGWIYPEGMIRGDGFIAREQGSIGRWICRGSVLVDASRQEPHTSANTGFYFGKISRDHLFPRTSLHALGLEGTSNRTRTSWRAVAGGTGDYSGASGEMGEQLIATNTSVFPGTGESGQCWRDEFDLWIPS